MSELTMPELWRPGSAILEHGESAVYFDDDLLDEHGVSSIADFRRPLGDYAAYTAQDKAELIARASTGLVKGSLLSRSRLGIDPLHGHRQHARDLAVGAMHLMFVNSALTDYTQTSARWTGLTKAQRTHGWFPRESDCSSSATWALFNGLGYYHMPDRVNGENWRAGYTGTMIHHGRPIGLNPRLWLKADALIWGPSILDTEHVVLCAGYSRKLGVHLVYNHGHQGTQLYPWTVLAAVMHLLSVRRYI